MATDTIGRKLTPRPPRWQGFVNDGWGVDEQGRCYFVERPRLDRQRIEAQALDMDVDNLPKPARPPGIFPVAIDGQFPAPEVVAEIRCAIEKLPKRFLRAWRAANGRIEVIPGRDVGRHPLYCDGGRPPLGFFSPARNIVVVAGDHRDRCRSVLHELAHAVDFALGISRRPEWQEICRADSARQRVSEVYVDGQVVMEHFAESFCNLFSGLGGYGPGASEQFCSRRAEDFIIGRLCNDP